MWPGLGGIEGEPALGNLLLAPHTLQIGKGRFVIGRNERRERHDRNLVFRNTEVLNDVPLHPRRRNSDHRGALRKRFVGHGAIAQITLAEVLRKMDVLKVVGMVDRWEIGEKPRLVSEVHELRARRLHRAVREGRAGPAAARPPSQPAQ